jgi:Domain of unknown function (DUF222)
MAETPYPTLVKELDLRLGSMAASDLHGMVDAEAAECLVELVDVQTRLDAAVARLAAHVDGTGVWRSDGSRSAAAWLERRTGRHRSDCRAATRRGRHLGSLPLVGAAFATGKISAWHVDRIAQLHQRWPDQVAAAQADIVGWACDFDTDEFLRLVGYWTQHIDPDGVEDDATARYRRRRVRLSDGIDGCGLLDVEFEPIGWATFSEALRRIEHEMWTADWADARARLGNNAVAADLARTDAQRTYDALIELAVRGASSVAGRLRPRPLVTVHVDHDTLAGRICQLSTGTVITPGEVLPLLADADIERAVFNSRSRIIDLGRRSRLFIGGTRRAVEITHPTCAHPSCRVPSERCDIDHDIEWEHGGPTNPDNGTPRCPPHHRHRHRRASTDGKSDGSDDDGPG